MKNYYKAKFPHIHPLGKTFFITFRLDGSIPKTELKKLEREYHSNLEKLKQCEESVLKRIEILNHRKKYFAKYDDLLHNIKTGPNHLKSLSIKDIIAKQLHRFDGKLYDLICYCIMSNHVHILIDTNLQIDKDQMEYQLYDNHTQVSYIMKRIKGASARYANQELGKKGRFWCKESYDMYIRNEKMLINVIGYILDNPVKAKLVSKWEDYEGNYLMP